MKRVKKDKRKFFGECLTRRYILFFWTKCSECKEEYKKEFMWEIIFIPEDSLFGAPDVFCVCESCFIHNYCTPNPSTHRWDLEAPILEGERALLQHYYALANKKKYRYE